MTRRNLHPHIPIRIRLDQVDLGGVPERTRPSRDDVSRVRGLLDGVAHIVVYSAVGLRPEGIPGGIRLDEEDIIA